jgi:hypothetical protein
LHRQKVAYKISPVSVSQTERKALKLLRLKFTSKISNTALNSIFGLHYEETHLSSYSAVCSWLQFLRPINYRRIFKNHYIFNLTQKLVMMYQDHQAAEQLGYGWDAYRNQSDFIADWWDGSRVRDMVAENLLTPDLDVSMLITGDGVQLFNGKQHETGIIDFTFLNLPPQTRSKANHTFTAMIISGPSQPKDMEPLLNELVIELRSLETVGFFYEDQTGTVIRRRACVALMSADIPFRAKLDGKRGTGSLKWCRYCDVTGESCVRNRTNYYPIRSHTILPTSEKDIEEGLKMLEEELGKPSYFGQKAKVEEMRRELGWNRRSVLFTLQSLSLVESTAIDIMHLVYNFSKLLSTITLDCNEHGAPHHAGKGYLLSIAQWKVLNGFVEEMLLTPSLKLKPKIPAGTLTSGY